MGFSSSKSNLYTSVFIKMDVHGRQDASVIYMLNCSQSFGIMMIVNVELGFLTFPFGLNLFVAMGMTEKSLTEVARAVMPFMALLLFCLMIITYVPWISLALPEWLMP